jgi:hypothetical protein
MAVIILFDKVMTEIMDEEKGTIMMDPMPWK